MSIRQENEDLASRLSAESDPTERFFVARKYLDGCDKSSVNRSVLKRLVNDTDELIRSEAVDFLITSGGLEVNCIRVRLDVEPSDLVRPRLWLAFALADPHESETILKDQLNKQDSPYSRAYHDAAMYVASRNPYFLYSLCAIACSDDLSASHSAIDLLQIVASDRLTLLKELVTDLTRRHSDNAEKAIAMLASL